MGDRGCYHDYIENICSLLPFNRMAHLLLGALLFLVFYIPIGFVSHSISNKFIQFILLLLSLFLAYFAGFLFEGSTAPLSNSGAADKFVMDTLIDL